jgi:hypothetical protein
MKAKPHAVTLLLACEYDTVHTLQSKEDILHVISEAGRKNCGKKSLSSWANKEDDSNESRM